MKLSMTTTKFYNYKLLNIINNTFYYSTSSNKFDSNSLNESLNYPNKFNSNSLNESLNNPNNIINTTDNINNIVKNHPTASFDLNVKSDSLTTIGEGLKIFSKVIDNYTPIISGVTVAVGMAKILNTLPPSQRLGGMITAGTLVSMTTLTSQAMYIANKNKKNNEINYSQVNLEEFNRSRSLDFDFNSFINSPLENPNSNFFINTVLENNDPEVLYTISIIIGSFGALYGFTTVLISFLIKFFKLENKEFVKSKPKLYKIVSLLAKGRDWTSFMVLCLVWLSLILIIFTSLNLLYFINSK